MLLTWTTLALAADYTADASTSLQQAVNQCQSGDRVLVDPATYDPTGDSPVWVDVDIVIESSSSSLAAPIPALVVVGANVELNRLELEGATDASYVHDSNGEVVWCSGCGVAVVAGGAIDGTGLEVDGWEGEVAFYVAGAKANLGDVRVQGAETPVLVEAAATTSELVLDGCALSENSGPVTVNGVAASTVAVEIDGCEFKNNASNDGPADLDLTLVTSLVLGDSDFTNSSSNSAVASVRMQDVGDADLDNNTWTGSEGIYGALHLLSTSDVANRPRYDLTNLGFLGGTEGGALQAEGEMRIVAQNLKFEGNVGDHGGAVRLTDAQFECTACRFLGNSATTTGGAISANDATVDIETSLFCTNNSDGQGKLLYANAGSTSMSHTVLQDHSGDISSVFVTGTGGLDLVNVTWTGVDGYALSGNLGDLRLWNSAIVGFDVGLAPASVEGVQLDYNLWWEVPTESSSSKILAGDEALFEDPRFVKRFQLDDCGYAPYPRLVSPLRGTGDANFATFRGALGDDIQFPWESPPEPDTGDSGDSVPWVDSVDSGRDSTVDSTPPDSPTPDSEPPLDAEPLTWVSGGCGGGLPAAALLTLGLILLARRER